MASEDKARPTKRMKYVQVTVKLSNATHHGVGTQTMTPLEGWLAQTRSLLLSMSRSYQPELLFFKAALGRGWAEGRNKLVKLPETEPEVFEAYVHWSYTLKIDVSGIRISKEEEPLTPITYIGLAKL
jgi:hypothetical protein